MPQPLPAPPSTPQPSPRRTRLDGRGLWGIALLGLIVSLSAPTHAAKPCERGPSECVPAKPAPSHHRKAHRTASAQPTDPDVFVARPVATDAAKKSPAPARKAKRAQP